MNEKVIAKVTTEEILCFWSILAIIIIELTQVIGETPVDDGYCDNLDCKFIYFVAFLFALFWFNLQNCLVK